MKNLKKFIAESNFIEGEYGATAFEDAMAAWEYAVAINSAKEFELEDILSIHRILMQRLNPDIAGKIRKCKVWVGGRECPNPGSLQRLLFQWFAKWTGCGYPRTWRQCREAHVEFEKIHPFVDGNGRAGRIIYNIQRINAGLSIDVIKEQNKFKYYAWFK